MAGDDVEHHDADIEDLKQSRDRYSAAGEWKDEADCIYELGNEYQHRGRYELAHNAFCQARTIYAEHGAIEDAADCGVGVGGVFSRQGRFGSAEKAFSAARQLYRGLNLPEKVAHCVYSIANVKVDQGELQQAADLFRQAREAYLAAGLAVEAADCLFGLGNTYLAWGRYPQAEAAYWAAQQSYLDEATADGVADCLFGLGNVRLKQQDLSGAQQLYLDAQQRYRALGSVLDTVNCAYNLGNISASEGRYEPAVQSFTEALAVADETGAGVYVAQCLHALGNVHKRTGDHRRAVRFYARAKVDFTRRRALLEAALTDLCIAQVLSERATAPDMTVAGRAVLHRRAVRTAVPALVFLDARRFQFRAAPDRRSWAVTVAGWRQWVFELAVQVGDQDLLTDLVEWSINAGMHTAGEMGSVPDRTTVPGSSATLREPDLIDTSAQTPGTTGREHTLGGAVRLAAGQHLPMSPPPRLRMPDHHQALTPYLDLADRRYDPIDRPPEPIRTW